MFVVQAAEHRSGDDTVAVADAMSRMTSSATSVDFNGEHRYFRFGLSLAFMRDTGEPRSPGRIGGDAEG
jgi:hypothetical protein